ncbi:hypothetical protein [Tepidiforma sp.]|uniref:hypothetical protein n=1 Tax=Tepidiforma sp. TaxID=2682230 RepID=UPI002ADE1387|nr:hypothetical protein [Tepidiforma sp.]
MRTENGIDVDIQAIERILAEGDLITIGFSLFPLRLLVDTRENEHDGQWAGIVEPVASVQERYLWLGKHRGSFGPPRAFAFFVWPKTVRNLVERGTLAILRARLRGETLHQFDHAIEQLLELERQAMRDAVRGSRAWPAIWEAQPRS